MIVRLVRMTLRPDAVSSFLQLYDDVAPRIRAREGCHRLELLADTRFPNIVSTLSWWEDEKALEAYRASDLFRTTWAATKVLFAAPAEAFSHVERRGDPKPALRTTG